MGTRGPKPPPIKSRFRRPTDRLRAVARHYLKLVSTGVRPADAKAQTVIHFQNRPYFRGVDFDVKHVEKCVRAYLIRTGEIFDHRVIAETVFAWEQWQKSTDPQAREWLARFMSDYQLILPVEDDSEPDKN